MASAGPGHHHSHPHRPDPERKATRVFDGKGANTGERNKEILKKQWPAPSHPPRVQGKYKTVKINGPTLYKELFQDKEEEVFLRWKATNRKGFGKWEIDAPPAPVGLPGDTSLIAKLTDPFQSEHFGIYTLFDKPIVNTETQDLVIQYETRFSQETCSGAYLKLLSAAEDPIASNKSFEVEPSTPYVIMFGPDRCGFDDKVHFILRYRNPVTNKFEEKHMINPPRGAGARDDRMHHYALHLNKDNTFEIYIDNVLARNGSLFTDFNPPLLPPKTIDDPDHKKPASWDDRKEIPDPFATEPADWNPDDLVSRTCTEARLTREPAKRRGEWKPPMIPNPKYAGPFPRRQIPNPEYFDDAHPNRLSPIAGIAFEILASAFYVAFDNIVITTSKGLAREYAEKVWAPRNKAELDYEEQERIKMMEEEERQVAEIKRKRAQEEAKKSPPKTEEERWAKKETELNERWEKGEIDFETIKHTARFVLYKYKVWGLVALRWIEKNPLPFTVILAALFALRYAMKSLRACLKDRAKKRKSQDKKKKAAKQQKKEQ